MHIMLYINAHVHIPKVLTNCEAYYYVMYTYLMPALPS